MLNLRATRRAVILILALVIAASLVLVGCSGKQPGDQASADRPIRISLGWTPNLDPAIGADEAASITQVNMYDTLVFPRLDGTVEPWVATDWEATPDGLSYTFNLRDDVVFHSGNKLTAEDVVFSMDRLITMGQGYSYLYKGLVTSTEAVGDYTVKFTLSRPFGPFVSTLIRVYILDKDEVMAHIDPAGQYGEYGDYGSAWLIAGNDAGSGPYKVGELKPGEYFTGVQFEDYWGGFDPNNPTYFKILATNESVTVRTLMSQRELEITDCFQPAEVLEALDEMEGIDIAVNRGRGMTNLTLNTQKAPTDDVHFRRAIAYAVDYATLTTTICPGYPKATGVVFSALAGYNGDAPEYVYDLDKAREELQQSRYWGQLDQYPVDIAWVAEAPDREKMALLIQAGCAEIGITANVIKVPWITMTENAANVETTAHGCLIGYGADYGEAGSLLASRFHSQGVGTWMQTDWLQDPDIDAKIEDALATLDWEERMAKYADLQVELAELCPAVPLIEEIGLQAYQSAYVTWAVAETGKAGKPHSPLMGYTWVMRDIQVYPDQVPD